MTDDYGKSASTTGSVNVTEVAQPPNSIGIHREPTRVRVGEPVTLTASASDPNNDIARYEWNLDDQPGYEVVTTEPLTHITYSTPGWHTVGLRVVDRTDFSLSHRRVVPGAAQRRAGATARVAGRRPESCADRADRALRRVARIDGDIVYYEWDLDGFPGYEVEPDGTPYTTYSYADPGEFQVSVRAYDAWGSVDVATETLRVEDGAGGGLTVAGSSPRSRRAARAFSARLTARPGGRGGLDARLARSPRADDRRACAPALPARELAVEAADHGRPPHAAGAGQRARAGDARAATERAVRRRARPAGR